MLGIGATLVTTRPTSTRTGVWTPGGRTRTRIGIGHCVESKVTALESQTAPTFTTWRIFPDTPELTGSEEPTKGETINKGPKCAKQ